MEHLVDSSLLVALFLDFDTHHVRAQKRWESLRGDIILPYGVVGETATVLTYKHSKEQANQFLDFIQHNKDISIVDADIHGEIHFYQNLSHRISFVDATLLYLGRIRNATLHTFDDQLERLNRVL